MESLDQCRLLEVSEKARNVFCEKKSFFRFRSDFLAFFARISYFKFLELKE